MAGQLVKKISEELTYAQDSIAENMSGKAADALTSQLSALVSKLWYYGQVISDCFGNQAMQEVYDSELKRFYREASDIPKLKTELSQ